MNLERGSGVLLHITSLPSAFGIGDLGPEAYTFADKLAATQQKYWQILPLNPTDAVFQHSPYSSISAFALNPLLTSPELLQRDGLLTAREMSPPTAADCVDCVDFDVVKAYKSKLLQTAWRRWQKNPDADFETFCTAQSNWLEDYALFMALKAEHDEKSWVDWPAELRDRNPKALRQKRDELAETIGYIKFQQYIVQKQWTALKDHCTAKGVHIIGDLPIYIEHGSVDVWRQPELFKLDENKRPLFVAGVPPDYFSETGQRWGNPIYDWEKMQAQNFDWWAARLARNLSLFDIVRIDHFRGLVAFWQAPASEKTAVKGEWVKAPVYDLFERLQEANPQCNIIAEDLGLMTDDVIEAMQRLQLPGMKVLQFAFNDDLERNPFLPHNYPENCVVYTGTHDNNTTVGWYRCDATDHEKWQIGAYLQREVTEENVHWELIELALSSRARAAIIPVQDILGLDERARMNTPGTTSGNWKWRLRAGQLDDDNMNHFAALTRKNNR